MSKNIPVYYLYASVDRFPKIAIILMTTVDLPGAPSEMFCNHFFYTLDSLVRVLGFLVVSGVHLPGIGPERSRNSRQVGG